jgi:uncharacterized membrane protein (DUF485 family)
MGNPEKEPLCSPVPLPESPFSALQKLKKGLNTVTTIIFCVFFVTVIGSELTCLATTPSVSLDIKTMGFLVGAAALLMLVVQVIDITES